MPAPWCTRDAQRQGSQAACLSVRGPAHASAAAQATQGRRRVCNDWHPMLCSHAVLTHIICSNPWQRTPAACWTPSPRSGTGTCRCGCAGHGLDCATAAWLSTGLPPVQRYPPLPPPLPLLLLPPPLPLPLLLLPLPLPLPPPLLLPLLPLLRLPLPLPPLLLAHLLCVFLPCCKRFSMLHGITHSCHCTTPCVAARAAHRGSLPEWHGQQ